MIKVVCTGSESTGKTELARRLASHFGAPLSEEFVRPYATARGGRLGFADHGPIARGQMANEDAAIARAKDLVILDTDLVSTVVYCEHYFGRCPVWIMEAARSRGADLHLLMAPDVPWLPDGVRDRGERREEMHSLFASKLEEFGFPCTEIRGEWEQRFRAACDAVARLALSA
ncbi:MAG: AAA family ATPase [Gemmatimonadaceae bacterium]